MNSKGSEEMNQRVIMRSFDGIGYLTIAQFTQVESLRTDGSICIQIRDRNKCEYN
jgi:hypothetical protein